MSASAVSHESFRTALTNGDNTKVKQIIKQSSINTRDSGGRTMLHWICLAGNEEILSDILQYKDIDVNIQDGQGQTPLHLSLSSRHPSLATLLLTHPSINVTLVDDFNRLCLHWICQHGYTDLLIPCLKGVNINAHTQSGDTALHWACTDSHLGCVQQLLLSGARADITNQRGQQPWHTTQDQTIIQMVKAHLPTSNYMEDDHTTSTATSTVTSTSSPNITSTPVTSTPVTTSRPPEKKKMVIKLKK